MRISPQWLQNATATSTPSPGTMRAGGLERLEQELVLAHDPLVVVAGLALVVGALLGDGVAVELARPGAIVGQVGRRIVRFAHDV